MGKTIPCATCPWRLSSTVGGADIPGFSIDMMRNLRGTVGPDDALRPIMACHGTPEGGDKSCIGYVYREGWRNINVRLLAAHGALDLHAIDDECESIPMWPTFADMLDAYEAAADG